MQTHVPETGTPVEPSGAATEPSVLGTILEALGPSATHPPRAAGESPRLDGVVIGVLEGFGGHGAPLVDFPGNRAGRALPALATVALRATDVGREVALLFAEGDPQRPVLLGLLQHPAGGAGRDDSAKGGSSRLPLEVQVDHERTVLRAEKEIVLRCGKASITLTAAGKIIIRGAYLLSRSSGVNRIKGGSVQIN